MIEKGRITSGQMALMIFVTVGTTGALISSNATGVYAGRDLWISVLWASLYGFAAVGLAIRLHRIYPGENIIQYSPRILGLLPGKAMGFIYLLSYLLLVAITLRVYSEFVKAIFLPQTPLEVIIGSMMLVAAVAVKSGVEVIARVTQVLIPPALIVYLATILLTIQSWDVQQLFPILENGIAPSLKGSMVTGIWFSEFFTITFLLPFLADRSKEVRRSMMSVISVMLLLIYINLICLFVFGIEYLVMLYPLFEATRYISYAQFFEHLDAIVLMIWMPGIFIKVCLVHYVVVLGTSQWLNLRDYRPYSLPLAFLTAGLSLWVVPSSQELFRVTSAVFSLYFPGTYVLLPLLLWLIAEWRNRGLRKGEMAQ
ncbi:GerAB/ArcD/ProY family transporter [Kroppenstedtia sanguinis]|uniref:Endospore germination permease n=1 Tax=Kroppenstedtia sanguinis TaxID=1380684 RepID=A0ABW4CAV1_9BACL